MVLTAEGFGRLCTARELLRDQEGPSVRPSPVLRARLACPASISPASSKPCFGATPHGFRTRARLERARRLLAATERSVTDVCMEVGFSSLGSFSALFKQRLGQSPSAYRRRLREASTGPGARSAALVRGCLSLMGGLSASSPARADRNSREASRPDRA